MTMKDFKKLLEEAETRLYQYPKLTARIDEMKQDIAALKSMNYDALLETFGSIVHVPKQKHKERKDPIDRFDAQIERLKQSVFADVYEVRFLRRALEFVRDDPYYMSIEYKYFRCMTDKQAILELHCSLSTLRRNRKRLLYVIVDVLYGVETDKLKGERNE